MEYRLHHGTGPSVEYLITRDGDDDGGRWSHLLDVRREEESDTLQKHIEGKRAWVQSLCTTTIVFGKQ